MSRYFFTSESVSEGHPDKVADQISDALLDAFLAQDPISNIACETYVKTGMVLVGGEIKTLASIDIEEVIRDIIRKIGYVNLNSGFDANSCAILNTFGKQSLDISKGINRNSFNPYDQRAGDQGIVFGFATDETDVFMPAPILYAHRLVEKHAKIRKKNLFSWLRPDAKSQVTFEYDSGKIIGVDTVVFSTQHSEMVSYKEIRDFVMEEIIFSIIPKEWISKNTKFHINPSGRFVIGGPLGDCGLTGRKIIVDTYGGMARHGGGSFSGKDPSKIDRSAAYAARYIAKNIVAAGISKKCEIQLSYAIGVSNPISIMVDTFGTGKISNENLVKMIKEIFDLRPYGIIKMLDLLKPIYLETSVYGHFGRSKFPWEKIDKIKDIKKVSENLDF
ncbi:S-adenosylmethionine synthase [Buchnera aphidicola (Tetraneura ulmi)]|uniref:methionine adenosyltransferase n=1 Tax=Buchnera aphidicola TaxID=9 RepID=UPI003464C5D1